jgi:predicted transcriptional regulator
LPAGCKSVVSQGFTLLDPDRPAAFYQLVPQVISDYSKQLFGENTMSEAESDHSRVVSLAVEVVAAFVSNNSLPVGELPALIQSTHDALTSVWTAAETPPQPQAKEPAVPIRKSITPEYIICLEDGLKFRSLKRHIGMLGMTPDQYREKWGLPADYPMAAPAYAAKRSALAKGMGLGLQNRKSAPETTGSVTEMIGNPAKAKRSAKSPR